MKEKKKMSLKDFKPLLTYFKKYRFKLIICSIILFIASGISIITGDLIGRAVDNATNSLFNLALMNLVFYLVLTLTQAITTEITYYFLSKMQTKVSNDMAYDTYCKSLALPAAAFEELESGEIINRITDDTSKITGSVESLIDIMSNLITTSVLLVYIFTKNVFIGLEITLFLVIYAFIVKLYTNKLKENHKKRKEEQDKFTSITTESVRGIREIKTLGIIDNLKERVTTIIKRLINASKDEIVVWRNYSIICNIFRISLEIGVYITCAILVFSGKITVAFFMSMTYYIYKFTYILEYVTDFSQTYEELNVSLNRVGEILTNTLFDDMEYGKEEINNPEGIIEFKNVTFGYPKEEDVLKNFNITFEPNKKIAIVGTSGSGKSTIFNLITRIFDPKKGTITLDGKDITSLSEESIRKNISIIRQDPFVFNRTILENFKLIDENITLDKVRKYAKQAYIDDYIMSLKDGYDTVLGEGGVNLSGGQKQRLAIARSLTKESKVILFDEATSALDNESQSIIKESIDKLAKDHTVIIVAHRLSTIMDADIIYVVHNGKVIDSGTHKELMKSSRQYKKLYEIEEESQII